jgi:benzoate/toluate 1,2-dioxygenase beta subunit
MADSVYRSSIETEAVARFLYNEARLLDERRWSEWLELFVPEGTYWVPLAADQADPVDHVSLFYEDALMRQVRAHRLNDKRAWSQKPPVRTLRTVANIQVEPGASAESIVSKSAFTIVEWRAPRQRILAGRYTHRLTAAKSDFQIVEKRVDLINCDAVHQSLEIFL